MRLRPAPDVPAHIVPSADSASEMTAFDDRPSAADQRLATPSCMRTTPPPLRPTHSAPSRAATSDETLLWMKAGLVFLS